MNKLDTTTRADSGRDAESAGRREDDGATIGNRTTEPTISSDVAFDVLRNARRRYVLYYLREESPRELGELAERIAARENDISVDALSSKQRKSVYTALYQTHLPKLADVGVVEYDRDRGVVWLTDAADHLEPYLEEGGTEDGWYSYFLGLSAVGGLTVIADGMGIGPFASIPSIILVVALISAFIALSIAYAASNG